MTSTSPQDGPAESDGSEQAAMISPETITGSFVPVVDPAVVAVELDGESVLYHETAKTVHVLNGTATVIWRCLDGRTTLDDLSAELAAVFVAPVEQVGSDVVTAAREFGRQGLLSEVEPDPEAVAESAVVPPELGEAPGD